MKKIIALYGSGKKGKTSTLKKLIEEMRKDSSFSEEEEKAEQYLNDDERIICTYKNKKIAITTGGDTEDIIKENLAFFEEHECDILVTATRTKGKTVDYIEDYENKNNIKIIWKWKFIGTNSTTYGLSKCKEKVLFDTINNVQAEDLLNCLHEVIKELNQNP